MCWLYIDHCTIFFRNDLCYVTSLCHKNSWCNKLVIHYHSTFLCCVIVTKVTNSIPMSAEWPECAVPSPKTSCSMLCLVLAWIPVVPGGIELTISSGTSQHTSNIPFQWSQRQEIKRETIRTERTEARNQGTLRSEFKKHSNQTPLIPSPSIWKARIQGKNTYIWE